MPRRVLALLLLALLLAVVPSAAQAKGATAASISGGGPGGLPGGPITIRGGGEPGSGTDLANLAEEAGMWAVLFEGGQPGRLDAAPATAARGPRYTITWTFPNGAGTADKVRQYVWPYAAGGPITYMPPGQKVLDGRTEGGWFRAADNLRQSLVALGLPKRPALEAAAGSGASGGAAPAGSPARATAPGRAPSPWPPRVAAGVALALAVAGGVALALRRRSTPGPAPTH
jgi:hypothetical protein